MKKNEPEKAGPSNRLFGSMGAKMAERRQRKVMLQGMFRAADANGDGSLTRCVVNIKLMIFSIKNDDLMLMNVDL